jgi:hypothetical protein
MAASMQAGRFGDTIVQSQPAPADLIYSLSMASLPPDIEIAAGWDACIASIARPAAQSKIRALFAQGFHKAGDIEDRLGFHIGQLGR